MAGLSDLYEGRMLDALLGDDHAPNMPDTVKVVLFLTMPNDDGTGGSEPEDTYLPVEMDNDSASWPDAVGQIKSNGITVEFPEAEEDWGTIVGWGLKDDTDALFFADYLSVPVYVSAGETKSFGAGALSIVGTNA